MGTQFKRYLIILAALVLLNYGRTWLDAQSWMPAALKRTPGVGLDDALDAAIVLGVFYAAHKMTG